MKRQLLFVILIITSIIACEKVYVPDLKEVKDVLVVEAVLISDQTENDIYLYKTLSFDDLSDDYPVVSGAEVSLIDSQGNSVPLPETEKGTYHLTGSIDPGLKYFLSIKYDGQEYLSSQQIVPDTPDMDTIYAAFESKSISSGAVESNENVDDERVLQLYADINRKNNLKYYRFGGEKVLEYMAYYDTIIDGILTSLPIWGWKTYKPSGVFNVAGPPKYSTSVDIFKHELEYFKRDYYSFIADSQAFVGWIYKIDQYGLSDEAYNYYSDINKQLEANGRIFDPIYIQMSGNIRCTSNPEIQILGNFEIESHKEYRYLIRYSLAADIFELKKIERFVDIPENGFRKWKIPSFWED